ncbi:MAG: polysaccharide deacetylase family protein [Ferruginibacter sp.]
MFYLVKTPKWVRKLFAGSIWELPATQKVIYLSFDDGPHPVITSFVLDELNKFGAKATFFCVGKNVAEHPEVFNRILEQGHATGNHTFNHLDGWKTGNVKYLQNILKAGNYIDSHLFRPPYGRITRTQRKLLMRQDEPYTIIMWSVLSGDFDEDITPEKCLSNVLNNAESGSVIVFHDSEKAYKRLRYVLPAVLKYFSEKGYQFEKIVMRS